MMPRYLALSAGQNVSLLCRQIERYRPQALCIQDANQIEQLREVPFEGPVFSGDEGLIALLDHAVEQARQRDDALPTVIVGISGIAGLAPTLHALQLGCRVLTANKETFVTGGALVKPYLDQIIPLDSEHNAIMQCMHGYSRHHIAGLTLTASGGPFLKSTPAEILKVTPAQALNHPKWSMGPKITVDSATLMNKGLEVIEAHWLFDLPYEAIDVAIHPQSIVHGAITFTDGSLLAHLGPTDMRLAIQYGLLTPERGTHPEGIRPMRLAEIGTLEFLPPDFNQFPALALAIEAGRMGQAATIVLNAADEVLVQRFLDRCIGFLDITRGIELALESFRSLQGVSDQIAKLSDVQALDTWARELAKSMTFPAAMVSV